MVYSQLRHGRVSIPGQVYFITTVTHAREPLFRDFLHARRAIGELRRLNDCAMVTSLAWVVMPDHLHWLLALGHGHSISIVAKMLKGRTTAAINRDCARREPVWQRAFFDRALRHDEDAAKVARYIVGNPLRAGLVTKLGDYPHWDAVWL